uniref:SWIB domain-containing protein n=1 Tax=Macrostomum lignano TaxID=282301 RepID=A0A1I8F3P8_9PLAT
DSCLPVALFEWRVENPTDEELEPDFLLQKTATELRLTPRVGPQLSRSHSTGDDDGQPERSWRLIHQQINVDGLHLRELPLFIRNHLASLRPGQRMPSLANRLWSSLINTGRLVKWPPTAASSESEAKLFAGTATKSGEEVATAVRGELFLKRLLPLSDVIAFAFAAYQLFYELQLFGHLG